MDIPISSYSRPKSVNPQRVGNQRRIFAPSLRPQDKINLSYVQHDENDQAQLPPVQDNPLLNATVYQQQKQLSICQVDTPTMAKYKTDYDSWLNSSLLNRHISIVIKSLLWTWLVFTLLPLVSPKAMFTLSFSKYTIVWALLGAISLHVVFILVLVGRSKHVGQIMPASIRPFCTLLPAKIALYALLLLFSLLSISFLAASLGFSSSSPTTASTFSFHELEPLTASSLFSLNIFRPLPLFLLDYSFYYYDCLQRNATLSVLAPSTSLFTNTYSSYHDYNPPSTSFLSSPLHSSSLFEDYISVNNVTLPIQLEQQSGGDPSTSPTINIPSYVPFYAHASMDDSDEQSPSAIEHQLRTNHVLPTHAQPFPLSTTLIEHSIVYSSSVQDQQAYPGKHVDDIDTLHPSIFLSIPSGVNIYAIFTLIIALFVTYAILCFDIRYELPSTVSSKLGDVPRRFMRFVGIIIIAVVLISQVYSILLPGSLILASSLTTNPPPVSLTVLQIPAAGHNGATTYHSYTTLTIDQQSGYDYEPASSSSQQLLHSLESLHCPEDYIPALIPASITPTARSSSSTTPTSTGYMQQSSTTMPTGISLFIQLFTQSSLLIPPYHQGLFIILLIGIAISYSIFTYLVAQLFVKAPLQFYTRALQALSHSHRLAGGSPSSSSSSGSKKQSQRSENSLDQVVLDSALIYLNTLAHHDVLHLALNQETLPPLNEASLLHDSAQVFTALREQQSISMSNADAVNALTSVSPPFYIRWLMNYYIDMYINNTTRKIYNIFYSITFYQSQQYNAQQSSTVTPLHALSVSLANLSSVLDDDSIGVVIDTLCLALTKPKNIATISSNPTLHQDNHTMLYFYTSEVLSSLIQLHQAFEDILVYYYAGIDPTSTDGMPIILDLASYMLQQQQTLLYPSNNTNRPAYRPYHAKALPQHLVTTFVHVHNVLITSIHSLIHHHRPHFHFLTFPQSLSPRVDAFLQSFASK